MQQTLAIGTISMGWHPSHSLESKIYAAKQFGIAGIELFDQDLNKFAKSHVISRLEAADGIGRLCKDAQLTIISYTSFGSFEGQPTPLSSRLETAREWCEIARRLGTTIIQVPSNFDAEAIGDEGVIVAELQALADLGLRQSPSISFAYEAIAWGKHVADWEESLHMVQLVDRPNFGLCLDTYHVVARLWADPTTLCGRRPGGDTALRASLQRFRDACPTDKIFYIQISDAEQARPPIQPGHPAYREDEHVLHSWCLDGRIPPFDTEHGAYLPLEEILSAWLVESRYTGWVSMEVFHRSMNGENSTPDVWAKRARESWDKIQKLLQERSQGTLKIH
ncbi:uncharacterized protein Z520_02674 [Fonsecaea multimorphosa CBS 102226]|uniref:Xylose isomerase-like TIM barrel domain-containing protein n=1 Tax=Fonsecaea multimorphosa CBS 102226 TaxID=1442371 RepID=A0A0D2IVN5_9EURO|nr:uncharacterized protein Z520_02674 [Fonsecaea multimorphosa CBS 102226]KIY01122.1 hypothetical protein Z520_02674 [Fonsecaea multimorphosa CBS 102226]OAL28743.1 hypothetical protein AYO22_02608 [Fonsecaea multimorphosa]